MKPKLSLLIRNVFLTFITLVNISVLKSQEITTIATGYGLLSGLTIDSNNKIYIVQAGTRNITKMDLDGSNKTTITPSNFFSEFKGIAVDYNGNLYVTNSYNKLLVKLNAQGNTLWTSYIQDGQDVALDLQGNVFVANGNYISQYNNSGQGIMNFKFPASSINGIAMGVDGFIYACSWDKDYIIKTDLNGNTINIGNGFSQAYGLTVDNNGNIYVADSGNHAIKKITPSGVIISIGSGFKYPTAVALDSFGDLYIADYGNNAVKKISASYLKILEEKTKKIEIFPNPSSFYFTIKGLTQKSTIQVLDTNGKLFLEKKVNGNESVNIEQLNKGLYFVKINNIVLKLIKK